MLEPALATFRLYVFCLEPAHHTQMPNNMCSTTGALKNCRYSPIHKSHRLWRKATAGHILPHPAPLPLTRPRSRPHRSCRCRHRHRPLCPRPRHRPYRPHRHRLRPHRHLADDARQSSFIDRAGPPGWQRQRRRRQSDGTSPRLERPPRPAGKGHTDAPGTVTAWRGYPRDTVRPTPVYSWLKLPAVVCLNLAVLACTSVIVVLSMVVELQRAVSRNSGMMC